MATAQEKAAAVAEGASSVDTMLDQLSEASGGDIAIIDLMSIADHLMGSLQSTFAALDSSILREFGAISRSINDVRREVASLQPHEQEDESIPVAGKELRAIVNSTEDATHSIMGAAENILSIEADTYESYREAVESEVMRIFESCSFQDITGQRVSRVVDALEDIDERVGRIAVAVGAATDSDEKATRREQRDSRKKALILNGPAKDGAGVGQDDIDAMFG